MAWFTQIQLTREKFTKDLSYVIRLSFKKGIKNLQSLFTQLESLATADVRNGAADDVLLELIVNFDSLPSQDVLEEALKVTGDSGACLSDATGLVVAVAKIRRYWTTCGFLSTAVRRYNLFQDVRVARIDPELPFVPRVSLPAKEYFRDIVSR